MFFIEYTKYNFVVYGYVELKGWFFSLGGEVYAIPLDKILNLNATKKTSTYSCRPPPSGYYF